MANRILFVDCRWYQAPAIQASLGTCQPENHLIAVDSNPDSDKTTTAAHGKIGLSVCGGSGYVACGQLITINVLNERLCRLPYCTDCMSALWLHLDVLLSVT